MPGLNDGTCAYKNVDDAQLRAASGAQEERKVSEAACDLAPSGIQMQQEVNQGSNEESKDANQSKSTLNLGYEPNYGTKCMNIVHPAPLGHQNPKTMKEAHGEYKKFKELKRKDDMSGG